ncbi:MAG: hypothetical protein MZV63_62795 [Marinilabiliales bacterium]|nr:hypothetical protein [Marinilabiliales bacterium]
MPVPKMATTNSLLTAAVGAARPVSSDVSGGDAGAPGMFRGEACHIALPSATFRQ